MSSRFFENVSKKHRFIVLRPRPISVKHFFFRKQQLNLSSSRLYPSPCPCKQDRTSVCHARPFSVRDTPLRPSCQRGKDTMAGLKPTVCIYLFRRVMLRVVRQKQQYIYRRHRQTRFLAKRKHRPSVSVHKLLCSAEHMRRRYPRPFLFGIRSACLFRDILLRAAARFIRFFRRLFGFKRCVFFTLFAVSSALCTFFPVPCRFRFAHRFVRFYNRVFGGNPVLSSFKSAFSALSAALFPFSALLFSFFIAYPPILNISILNNSILSYPSPKVNGHPAKIFCRFCVRQPFCGGIL